MWKRYFAIGISSLAIGVLMGLLITMKSCSSNKQPDTIVINDTIVRTDTAYIASKTKILYKTTHDTIVIAKIDSIHEVDTIRIEIPIEHKEYRDTFSTDSSSINLAVKFSGYHTKIDSVGLDYNFLVEPKVITKKKGFGWCLMPSINLGYGLGVNPSTSVFTPYIGVGVSIGWGYHW